MPILGSRAVIPTLALPAAMKNLFSALALVLAVLVLVPASASAQSTLYYGTTGTSTNGDVGIGTATPANLLQVATSSGQNDTYGYAQVYYTGTSNSANSGYTVKNYEGTSQFMQWQNSGVRIGSRITTDTGAGNVYFTSGNDAVRMYLDGSTGDVGIGITSPGDALVVNNSTANTGLTISGNEFAHVIFNTPTYTSGVFEGMDGGGNFTINQRNNQALYFGTNNTTRMYIAAAGNVGIGSTSPVVSLDLSQKTDAVALPVGTTGQRPTGTNGEIRYNTSSSTLEAYVNGAWVSLNTSGANTVINSDGRLTGSGTTIDYCPYKGNLKTTALYGNYTIPSGCLTASLSSMWIGGNSGQAAAASTRYYVYLINVSGTTYLDLETTGHATDSSTGIEIMSGNNNRTLVGMIYTNGSKEVNEYATNPGDTNTVATWDNRSPTTTRCEFTAQRNISATTTPTLINGENSCHFMSWGDAAQFTSDQYAYTGNNNNMIQTVLCLDGTATCTWVSNLEITSFSMGGYPAQYVMAVGPVAYSPTEGYHYTELLGGNLSNDGTNVSYMSGLYTTVFTMQ